MSTLRVLLVEDSPSDALLVDASLQSGRTASVLTTCDRLAAAETLLSREEFDVVLLDLSLPDGTGLENYRRLARVVPRTPIIVLTGVADEGLAMEAISTGAADYQTKGATDAPMLERSIRYAIERKRHEIDRLELERARIARAEAEAANRAKDNFLATLSHELRTPLNAILGWASLLRTGQLGERETEQALETIERNARVQAQLVEDLLDVSRIVTGNLKLSLVSLELIDVVREAVEAQLPVAGQKGVELRLETTGNPMVVGDPTRLQQVAWNLIANAIKFTPAGGAVFVRVEETQGPPGKDGACLIVADTGQGIDADFLPHIFERFRQADASPTRRHGGLGLGLAIVQNVVALHEGTVEVESGGSGHGALFKVWLPASDGDGESIRPPSKSFSTLTGLDAAKILVLASSEEGLAFAREAFGCEGAELREARTAEAALAHLNADGWRPHLIVSDLVLEHEDGYAFLRRLRSNRPDLKDVPIVALTAHNPPGESDRAHAAGFAAFWPKPISPQVAAGAAAVLLEKCRKVEAD
jgi:signal transduction histidine kinase